MKKVIFAILFCIMVFGMTGCGNSYPAVKIDPSLFGSIRVIDIGEPYEYNDYDLVKTDEGKDVVVHFVIKNKSS